MTERLECWRFSLHADRIVGTFNLYRIRVMLSTNWAKSSCCLNHDLGRLNRLIWLFSSQSINPPKSWFRLFVRLPDLNRIQSSATYLSESEGDNHVTITPNRIGWLRDSNPVLHIHSVMLYQISESQHFSLRHRTQSRTENITVKVWYVNHYTTRQ